MGKAGSKARKKSPIREKANPTAMIFCSLLCFFTATAAAKSKSVGVNFTYLTISESGQRYIRITVIIVNGKKTARLSLCVLLIVTPSFGLLRILLNNIQQL
jgi:hypothetical protein